MARIGGLSLGVEAIHCDHPGSLFVDEARHEPGGVNLNVVFYGFTDTDCILSTEYARELRDWLNDYLELVRESG